MSPKGIIVSVALKYYELRVDWDHNLAPDEEVIKLQKPVLSKPAKGLLSLVVSCTGGEESW